MEMKLTCVSARLPCEKAVTGELAVNRLTMTAGHGIDAAVRQQASREMNGVGAGRVQMRRAVVVQSPRNRR